MASLMRGRITKNGDEEGGKGGDDDKDERESAGFMPNSPSGGAIR